jgi:hypothetical protein
MKYSLTDVIKWRGETVKFKALKSPDADVSKIDSYTTKDFTLDDALSAMFNSNPQSEDGRSLPLKASDLQRRMEIYNACAKAEGGVIDLGVDQVSYIKAQIVFAIGPSSAVAVIAHLEAAEKAVPSDGA